jgi:CBS domain containing-hemolysin-like protein
MLDENLTIKEAIESINNNQYSRIPIYSQTQNNITGFIHIKDVLLNLYSNNTLKQIKKEALFVRYNKKAGDVLENMQNTGTHLACVLDKNKNVCGIITMEDLIEEIFGEIYDEKELTPHRPIKINKNIYLMHINTKISKINEIFPNSLPKVYDSLTILEFISGKISSFEQKKCLITDNLKLKIQSTMRGKPKIIKVIKLNKKNI